MRLFDAAETPLRREATALLELDRYVVQIYS